uniref:Cadherin-23-like n=1 Tax=Saccoglossus kowalevskii TaxID=10224 RepID=A0ABM0M3F3_SACKO|nr:PREDICTED: cadherin-23-like [Saccoglossus kowalevskii]
MGPSVQHVVPIGPSGQQVVPMGASGHQVVPMGPSGQQVVPMGPSGQQIVPMGQVDTRTKWTPGSSNRAKWAQGSSNRAKWAQGSSNGAKWTTGSSNEAKWTQGSSNGAKWTTGVATSAEYGSRVTRVEANDPDDDINGIVRYVITDQICEVDDQPNVCQDENGNPKDPFTLDPLDGTIYTNIVFEPGWTGYFDLKISAFDIDNKTDDTQLSIYLLRDDQRVKIVVYDEPDDVVTWIDDFMAEIENITGALCSADSIQTHVDRNNEPNSDMTDIYIHCVDPETNEIMDVQEIIYLLDTYEDNLDALFEEYNVVAIVPAVVPDNTVDTNAYIQIATGILLIVALFLLFLLIYCYCSMRSRYQRKLRAARAGGNLGTGENELKQNPLQVPGTNQYKFEGSNPIWNTPEMDIYSEVQEPDKNSLDENEVSDDANSEDQEVTVDLYNDDYDYYNKLPPEYAESDEFLDAALGELEKHKIGLDLDDMEITAV